MKFDGLFGVAKELHCDLVLVYWALLVPLLVTLITLEFLKSKDQPINAGDILRRVVVSMLLLYSFDYVINSVAFLGDSIVTHIDKQNDAMQFIENLRPEDGNATSDWWNVRNTFIWLLGVVCYMVAYLGFFLAEALTYFVWTILYVVSPLMILAYISERTQNITYALYKGLFKVVIWRILWVILAELLIKLSVTPQGTGLQEYMISAILNVCVGLSMLFIPFFTKSLLGDGLQSAATGMIVAPAAATAGAVKLGAKKLLTSSTKGAVRGAGFAARPLTNPITSRLSRLRNKTNESLEKYGNLNRVETEDEARGKRHVHNRQKNSTNKKEINDRRKQ